MSNILVTGGSGFIGSHLVNRLIEDGHMVHIIDKIEGDPTLQTLRKAKYHKANVKDLSVIDLIQDIQPDFIFHLAAHFCDSSDAKDIKETAETNIIGTIHIMEGARLAGVEKVIFTSSAAIYGPPAYLGIDENHPLSPKRPYGMTKRSAEEFIQLYARLHNINYTILRLSTVYGIRQRPHTDGDLIADLIQAYLHKAPIHFDGAGQRSLDLIYIKDVLDALLSSMTRGDKTIFNIGSGHGTTANEVINLLNATFEVHVEPEFTDVCPSHPQEMYFDISLSLTSLDWSPKYDIADGLLETVHYYRRMMRM